MIDVELADDDTFMLYEAEAKVWDVPGHTSGHIAYWFAESRALFCGDTLFALGCGRLFEGTPQQMWTSLQKILSWPNETLIYCAHEYTQANARFALSVEPDNADLLNRNNDIDAARQRGEPTVPTTLGLEKRTNPFLRPDSPHLQETIGLSGQPPVEVFARTRELKDRF